MPQTNHFTNKQVFLRVVGHSPSWHAAASGTFELSLQSALHRSINLLVLYQSHVSICASRGTYLAIQAAVPRSSTRWKTEYSCRIERTSALFVITGLQVCHLPSNSIPGHFLATRFLSESSISTSFRFQHLALSLGRSRLLLKLFLFFLVCCHARKRKKAKRCSQPLKDGPHRGRLFIRHYSGNRSYFQFLRRLICLS